MTEKGSNLTQENLKYLRRNCREYKVGGGIIPDLPNSAIHWGKCKSYFEALDEIGDLSNWGSIILPGYVIFDPQGICVFDLEDQDSQSELRNRELYLNGLSE